MISSQFANQTVIEEKQVLAQISVIRISAGYAAAPEIFA